MRLVFSIIAGVCVFVLCLFLLAVFFRLLGMLISFAVAIALLVGFFYLISFLLKLGGQKSEAAVGDVSVRILDPVHNSVMLFLAEPSLSELVQVSEAERSKIEQEGLALRLESGTTVKILSESAEKQAVHIQVNEGMNRGQKGWVCRSVLRKGPLEISSSK